MPKDALVRLNLPAHAGGMKGDFEPQARTGQQVTVAALFSGFFQAGIFGFGGVFAVARRIIVDQRRWLTQDEFNDLFSLCQFLPGANIVNLAFAFGARNRGLAGAAAAITGLFAAPIVIVLGLGVLYARYGNIPLVQHGLGGLAAAGAGLVLGSAMKLAAPILKGIRPVIIAALTLGLVILAHFSLPLTMALVLPLSIALAWRA